MKESVKFLKKRIKQIEAGLKVRKQYTDFKICRKCGERKEYKFFKKEDGNIGLNCNSCRKSPKRIIGSIQHRSNLVIKK